MTLLRHLFSLVLCLFVGVLLTWSWHLKDPRMIMVRDTEVALLLAGSLLCGAMAAMLRPGVLRAIALWGVILTALLTVGGEAGARYRRQAVLDRLPEAQALSQHFVVGYRDPRVLRDWVARGLVGGVFITTRNVQDRSLEEIRAEIAELQALRRQTGLPPLVISTDQEGGAVSRMTPPLPRRQTLAALVAPAHDDTARVAIAYDQGRRQGLELAALGINVNFSPVVDLKVEHGPNPLDFNSLISTRAISADPVQTTLVAQAYSLGLQQQGVTPTLKHFPGLGNVREDTHHFAARLDTDPRTLRQRDWLPFRDVAARTHALIMLGHVVLPEIDAQAPASMSRAVVQGVIRDEWRHEGALVTDDLTMAAAYDHGLCKGVPEALNAGVDLLLISYDVDKYFDAMYCAIQAARKRSLDDGVLAQSRQRLQTLRARWPAGRLGE
jgi:beta-N-acetylhexosaminidase